jgi:hypothetical protein
MSDEQRNEETEVEAHRTGIHASDEPRDEAETGDEVEGHGGGSRFSGPSKLSANDETEDEVEGHASKTSNPKYS